MGYWIYGRDATSDEPARRIYSEAVTEAEAHAEAVARGMQVEAVRPALPGERDAESGMHPVAVPVPGGPYEFTLAQNETIASLARYMRLAGIALLAFGVIQIVAGFLAERGGIALFIQGALSLVLGALAISIAGHFRRIVDSHGRDIRHLMDALGRLRVMYAIQVWAIAAGAALIAIVIVVALLR
ncbi:MAG TPA: hypothetical protein VND91_00480 [Candidatus Saccharimonadia bacterium]|nr:hypothetical protein [Candidatus Saccharimonadia bacterium]